MLLLTNSRAKEARACLRSHHNLFELGYRSVHESAALRFGTLWHLAMERWWKPGLAPEARLGEALAFGSAAADVDPFDLVKAEELLRGYTARWGEDVYETLAVEREFRAPMINPATGAASKTWQLAGKIDLVIRDGAGRVLLGEHKTSALDVSPGSQYWRALRLDGQIGMYYEGARSLGFDVQGCLYDVVHKPALRPLKATPIEARKYKKGTTELYANQRAEDETPDEYRARLREDIAQNPSDYFQRGEVVRLDEEMQDNLFDLWALGRMIREAEIAKRWPKNPDACSRWGTLCQFFPSCTGEASLDDATVYQRSDNVHPELAGSDVAAKGQP